MAFPHDGVKFEPGESGNPKGLPKGTKHISTWIQNALEEEVEYEDIETKRKYKQMPIQAIVQVAIKRSQDGDNKWAEWLAKHGYAQKLQLGNDPDNPLTTPADPALNAEFLAFMKQRTNGQ